MNTDQPKTEYSLNIDESIEDESIEDESIEDESIEDESIDSTEEASSLWNNEFYNSPTVEYDPAQGAILGSLIGFFSPGSFLTLGNKPHYGIAVNLVLAMLLLVLSFASVWFDLFPVPLFAFALIPLVSVWIYGVVAVVRHPPKVSSVTPWAQAGIAFLTFWMPFVMCFYLASSYMLQRAWMSNDNMTPGIVQGDVILVDRFAFRKTEPTYGDIVLIEEIPESPEDRRRAFFGRIIACGGDEVQLRGVHPVVNGTTLPQYLFRDDDLYEKSEHLVYETPYQTAEPGADLGEPGRWYPVMMPQELLFSHTNSVRLEQDYYYVLEDNRTSGLGHVRTSYGFIVHRSEIQGRPKYIIYNTDQPDHFARYGLAVR